MGFPSLPESYAPTDSHELRSSRSSTVFNFNLEEMFALVYRFRIHENTEQAFISSWAELTRMIRKHEGSLGSRLHKEDETTYIAYAQ